MYGRKYMGIVRSAFLIDEAGKIEQAWYKISPRTPPQAQEGPGGVTGIDPTTLIAPPAAVPAGRRDRRISSPASPPPAAGT